MEDSNAGSKAFSHSFCGLRKVHFQCYCGQLKFNRIVLVLKLLSMTFYIIVKTLVQIPFCRILVMEDSNAGSKAFSYSFCGLRKEDIQCYCAQLKFNRMVLVLKLLSMTFYIIVETLAQIPFVEASKWRFKKLFRRPFLTVFAHYARYVSNASVLSSTSIGLFLCSNYFQRPFISSLKVWFRYLLQNPRYGGFKCLLEGLLSQFLRLRNVRFQCYFAQFKFNRIFLMLKLLSMTFYIIVETLAQIPFVEVSLWRFKKLFRRPFLTVFAHYAKYVSNASVLSSTSIGLFLCSNYFQ